MKNTLDAITMNLSNQEIYYDPCPHNKKLGLARFNVPDTGQARYLGQYSIHR